MRTDGDTISIRGRSVQSYPRGFAPRTPLHALSLAASPARSVRVARSQCSLASCLELMALVSISNQQSAISNQQSAISNQQSAIRIYPVNTLLASPDLTYTHA